MYRAASIAVLFVALLSGCASHSTITTSTTLPTEAPQDGSATILATLLDGRQLEIAIDGQRVLKQNLANKSAINSTAIFDKNNHYTVQCQLKPGTNFRDHTQCTLNFKNDPVCTYDYWLKDTILKKYHATLTCGDNQDSTRQAPQRLYHR